MPGDIFYTEVDSNLKKELNARGRSGFNRSAKSLNFMLDKVANVQLAAYDGSDRNTIIRDSVIGPIVSTATGTAIKSSFLPDSYLDTTSRTTDIVTNLDLTSFQIKKDAGKLSVVGSATKITGSAQNVSQRIPPVITACSMTISDNSQAALNKAEIQILIPNADVDLDTIEKIYFRPGRLIQLRIVHPNSAVITGQSLTSGSVLPSFNQMKQENSDLKLETINKINEVHFEGVITSFEFSYEQDASVSATIFTTGISNVYTDLTMLINDQPFLTSSLGHSYVDGDISKKSIISGSADADEQKKSQRNTLYDSLAKEVFDLIGIKEKEKNSAKFVGSMYSKLGNANEKENSDRYIAVTDSFDSETNSDRIYYVSLAYLIDFINRTIIRNNKTIDSAKIICNDILCKSNYYEHLVSSDPRSILLFGKNTQTYGKEIFGNKLLPESPLLKTFLEKNQTENYSYPSRILISLACIQSILDNIDPIEEVTDNKQEIQSGVQIKHFLRRVSDKISTATGRAIDMKLICHPNDTTMSSLLFYDANFAGAANKQQEVVPFSVPMFANHENGTIVREFSIKAKLPGSAKSLAFVLNDGTDVSEAKIAPFLQFMYQDDLTSTNNAVKDMIKDHAEKHIQYLEELNNNKIELSNRPYDATLQGKLKAALIKYIQYPKERISESVLLGSPQFPYEVTFTIDGVAGFRYGDVLTFEGIPKRYRNNTVFSIKDIQHNVDTTGMWTTKISCIMRPKL
jgi:hypothetical protein